MSSPDIRVELLLEKLAAPEIGEISLMEVCGTHTMSIAKSGLRSMLPKNVRLLSGPGCPVCVTPAERIDEVLKLSMDEDVIMCSYGDMLRVPGSVPGDSLQRRKAVGAAVETVYSPMDAVKIAAENPSKQIVFLGVGFETTAPGTAAAALYAKEQGIENFFLWSMLKTVEPALRALIGSEGFNVDGFICPGHVATIIGERGFEFLPREYGLPAVIAGFEPENILLAIYRLAMQIRDKSPKLENVYRRAVNKEGNELAQNMLGRCFSPRRDSWRGLGEIEGSGLMLKDELSDLDAERHFNIVYGEKKPTACRCGQVICGKLSPRDCPMFGGKCAPENPLGPCMVSSEGACAAAYKYGQID